MPPRRAGDRAAGLRGVCCDVFDELLTGACCPTPVYAGRALLVAGYLLCVCVGVVVVRVGVAVVAVEEVGVGDNSADPGFEGALECGDNEDEEREESARAAVELRPEVVVMEDGDGDARCNGWEVGVRVVGLLPSIRPPRVLPCSTLVLSTSMLVIFPK